MSRTLAAGAAMLLAPALLATTAQAQSRSHGFRNDDAPTGVDTTIAFAKGGTVNLTLLNGDIVVRGWSQNQVKVHATSDNGGIRFNASSDHVTLELDRGGWQGGDARFEITVPAGTRVVAHTTSGDIDVRGTRGDVETRTQNGDLRIEDVGRLDAGSLSGDVTVRGASGDASVHTVSGDFHINGVTGDVEAESVSGDIEIHGAVAKFVRAHTVSGDITYDGTIDPAGRYELSAHSGEVSIALPRTASAQVTVSTWSGSVDSAFPITLKPGEHSNNRFTFEIGGGAARVTLESFSGDISISSHSSQ